MGMFVFKLYFHLIQSMYASRLGQPVCDLVADYMVIIKVRRILAYIGLIDSCRNWGYKFVNVSLFNLKMQILKFTWLMYYSKPIATFAFCIGLCKWQKFVVTSKADLITSFGFAYHYSVC